MASEDSTDEAVEEFPRTAAECWELGRQIYAYWKKLQTDRNTLVARSREPLLRKWLKDAPANLLQQIPGSREQRELARDYGVVQDFHEEFTRTLNENETVKDMMVALGNHMRENNLVDETEQTFPVERSREDWDKVEAEEAEEAEKLNRDKE
ncbi:hypothetical protein O1611_g813 [Lasiodiplodia mahajangana]|uniref:Uncharacterized protein n=1 Tax=Lasiodiplodia mahajangana TaxID=1108764 RepID=A0ACC2JZB5_9PEZI|nr:hypothetical protein O1611_g813 [Lasiodiplodia mahajangana]